MSEEGKIITLAITGASGALFARALLRRLEADERVRAINLVVTDAAYRVLRAELDVRERSLDELLGGAAGKTRLLDNNDIGAEIASGSYPTDAMIVLPCSMGSLAKIAHGLASQLLERAADVCLKEHIPLLLCVRETPFNRIHLRNMTLAAEAGATIFPVIPAFYNHPRSLDELATNFAARLLKHLGLPQANAYVWRPEDD